MHKTTYNPFYMYIDTPAGYQIIFSLLLICFGIF